MKIAGIDFGTGFIKFVFLGANGAPKILKFDGVSSMISCIYMEDSGEILLGEEAFNLMFCDPEKGCLFWKRHMGTDDVILNAGGKEYRVKDILRIFVEHVKKVYENQTGYILEEIVMTVPANYNDRQKRDTREAAEECGLRVLTLEHEPISSMLGNHEHHRAPGSYLIYDIGAGTSDFSVILKSGDNITVLGTSGIPQLGGMDFTERLVRYVVDEFNKEHGIKITREHYPHEHQDVFQRVDRAKRSLSERNKTKVVVAVEGKPLSVKISRDKFNELCSDLIEKIVSAMESALESAKVDVDQLNAFIPVGGGSLVAGISDAVERRFGLRPSAKSDVHHAVALGALVAARLEKARNKEPVITKVGVLPPPSIVTRDVTTHDIGVTVLDEKSQELFNAVIMNKGISFPSIDHTKKFKLADRLQTDAIIEILQGSNGVPRDECLVLGTFELRGLSRVTDPNHEHEISITMNLDGDGILSARARDNIDGKEADLQIEYANKAN